VLDCGPEELSKQPVCRVHLDRHRLPADDALAVVIDARSEQPADYAVSATGIQRLDQITPQGDEIQIRRTLRTLDGQPQGGRLRVGEVVAVHLAIKLDRPQSYLILEDRRPAGCEFADERLDDRSAGGAANVEFRDDRVAAFFTSLPAGRHELVYYLRAETPGTCHVLPGVAYPMYNDRLRGETGSLKLDIE